MDRFYCVECGKRSATRTKGDRRMCFFCHSCGKPFGMRVDRVGSFGSYPVDFMEKLDALTPEELCAEYAVSFRQIREWIFQVNQKLMKGKKP